MHSVMLVKYCMIRKLSNNHLDPHMKLGKNLLKPKSS